MDVAYRLAGDAGADNADIGALKEFYQKIDIPPRDYFEQVFEKDCAVLMAEIGGTLVGFALLNYEPKYWLYKKLNAPEIQDVNVLPDYRQQGIATAMIEQLEAQAGDKGHDHIGICVALTKEFGPAQKLYYKLGYEPDGYGATYDREPLEQGKSYPANAELALMMIKEIKNS